MATILVVDDRPTNREFLVTLLGYGGHRLLEAADGAEALAMARAEHPDLVIADILMPTMDGYEFVRHLRADPTIAATPVVFFTAQFHEREARNLAKACGVAHVLTKPCEPDVVLRTVDAALGVAAAPTPAPLAEEFDREHLRLLTDKLSQNADELRRANERLTALVDLGLELGSERDPRQVLQAFCHTAREIIGAKYAIAGILDGDGLRLRYFFISGMDAETSARLGSPDPGRGGPRTVLRESRCLRLHNPGGDPAAIDFPSSYPPIHTWLGAPIISPGRVHGWLGLLDKVGAGAFSDEDERLAGLLAAQVGRIYENGSLYADLLRQAADLQQEIAERKRSEEALRQSEERFRSAFEHTGVATVLTDIDNRFVRVNAAFARMFGYSEAEMLGMSMADLTHPDDVAESYARREGLLAGKEPFIQMEKRYRRKDGRVLWGLTNVTLLRDPGDRPMLYIGQVKDITERKQLQDTLAAERNLLRTLIDALPDVVFTKDLAGRFVVCNRALLQLVGLTREQELAGRTGFDLFPREMADIYHADDLQTLGGRGVINREEPCVDAAGNPRWHLTIKVPQRDRAGAIVGLIGISRNITERKQAEQTLRDSEERFRQLAENIREVFWLSDPVNSKILYVSPAFETVWGRSCESLYASPRAWLEAIHSEDRERVRHAFLTEQVAGRYDEVYRIVRPDGSVRWIHDRGFPVRDATGAVYRIAGVAEDVTERKSLEDQFRQAQKMEAVGRLAGGVAHDFNNLLTVINGYGELLLERLPAGDSTRELIREMVVAGGRAAALTRQLLAFSRKAIIEPKILDLKALVADVDKMLHRILGEDIQLTIVTDPESGAVKADPGQVEQVILNLVVNARDAMPQGGRLTIEVRSVDLDETYAREHADARSGPHVLLAVSDTGCGMDAAALARIWEPFFTTKGTQGTGLGLATVHGIVKQSGGHVTVYSEVGHGTTFKAYLPRVAERPLSQIKPGQAVMPRGSETVLLVEDEDGVRALTRRILEGCGYPVLEGRDGAEALRVAGQYQGPIHLLVTDVVLPRMGGREVAERLAGIHPKIRVLFLSGYTDDAVVRHGILEAEVAFLQKPFSPASFATKVREVLDGQ
jgi:PAS domain S-box-containing protein